MCNKVAICTILRKFSFCCAQNWANYVQFWFQYGAILLAIFWYPSGLASSSMLACFMVPTSLLPLTYIASVSEKDWFNHSRPCCTPTAAHQPPAHYAASRCSPPHRQQRHQAYPPRNRAQSRIPLNLAQSRRKTWTRRHGRQFPARRRCSSPRGCVLGSL